MDVALRSEPAGYAGGLYSVFASAGGERAFAVCRSRRSANTRTDRKSTRLNSSPTEISTLPLHDALPISDPAGYAGGLYSVFASAGGERAFAVCRSRRSANTR